MSRHIYVVLELESDGHETTGVKARSAWTGYEDAEHERSAWEAGAGASFSVFETVKVPLDPIDEPA